MKTPFLPTSGWFQSIPSKQLKKCCTHFQSMYCSDWCLREILYEMEPSQWTSLWLLSQLYRALHLQICAAAKPVNPQELYLQLGWNQPKRMKLVFKKFKRTAFIWNRIFCNIKNVFTVTLHQMCTNPKLLNGSALCYKLFLFQKKCSVFNFLFI